MLHTGIAKSFEDKKNAALHQQNVKTVAVSEIQNEISEGIAALSTTTARDFLSNPVLHQEVFGPYSLVIRCFNSEEMIKVAKHLEGQLTSTIMASDADLSSNAELIEQVTNICGRFIINSVPTGVTVCLSMQHGGPFPATTDSRFTSVGADGIKRFARPVCFQNWPDKFLPDALKNNNPLHIWRTINDQLTQSEIE
jgi:NADP-dependent aldehyde dehydrogenase